MSQPKNASDDIPAPSPSPLGESDFDNAKEVEDVVKNSIMLVLENENVE